MEKIGSRTAPAVPESASVACMARGERGERIRSRNVCREVSNSTGKGTGWSVAET